MLLFVFCVSLSIATLMALMHRHDGSPQSDNKVTVGTKTFIVSFIVIYFGLVFFTPQLSFVTKGQVIETCDPDF
jgi:hypothetical protein